ncbi:guanitoxin biosynthesis L-enduracididine beta-hydroxylase GntD [Streptomyces sp.]|uniref:guanitoxin biosynthesis L-enduracididine beta-hydroxylase GntD n=1 Tax=Streptomyces sp. TaxID=1931 RepID=UPI002F4084BF
MLSLNQQEAEEISGLLAELRDDFASAEEPEFLLDAPVHARRLPRRVQDHLNRFRREEPGFTVITGHRVDDTVVGPTPSHWNQLGTPSPTLDQDLLLVLYGALLGDVFGWATQQDGRMVHDVLPIKVNEGQQLGSAADVLLDWHTEDAFHPHRPDWVVLACLRNPTDTPTTIATADHLRLSDEDVAVLFEPRFRILPDNSHLPQHNSAPGVDFGAVERMFTDAPSIPLLWGDPDRPYMRVDRSFWGVADPADVTAGAVLERFTDAIEAQLREVVLRPGDFCFLDNYKVAHGRKPFPARYDGTDRWLKRVCVTRDLRKSRTDRPHLLSQVLG